MAPLLNTLLSILSFRETVIAFSSVAPARIGLGNPYKYVNPHCYRGRRVACSSPNDDDDWEIENAGEGPRFDTMRSMLESSWDHETMGPVPSGPEEGAEAASEGIADAMRAGKNVLMVDLRLPSYDVTEGPELYDPLAAFEFCSCLSDNLRARNLIRKSLVLVRSDKERAAIDHARSQRDGQVTTSNGDEVLKKAGETEDKGEVDDFRQQLMSSWDSISDDEALPPPLESDNSSHRLWSMIGTEELSRGPDMFNQVIAAVDENALLKTDEDALIILAPHGPADTIGVRRIMARYGHTRTIILVNSRMEQLPRELAPAVLVYGLWPLIASAPGNDPGEASGLKAVVMKRFPADWAVYVDVSGEGGFLEATGLQSNSGGTDKTFPSPEWIVRRVQAHVEGLTNQQ